MNIRQQKYKKNRLLGMNQYNAAIAAGYSENSARNHTTELEKRVKIEDVLERKGLTDEVLVAKHKELLDAYKLIIVNGEAILIEKGGIKQPELFIQIKALELAYKLKNHLKEKIEHSGKIEGGERNILIIRDGNGNKTETLARPICVQQEALPGPVELVGDRKDAGLNLAGNAIQRANP